MMKEVERGLDSQLWHACAGGMVQMPPVNSKIFYFPQGHAEHTLSHVSFGTLPRIPALILCRVAAIKFMADTETDEVYAAIRLIPIGQNEFDYNENNGVMETNGFESVEKSNSFAKTLTQSDANNGGGFSVPRYCAETIFPRLDYTADPPVQTVVARDVHGEIWKFRHIYRGTPRRHLLTTGWSTFVNQKKLVAGDSIVFMRTENGDLCVGIRRAKRGSLGSPETPSGWTSGSGNCPSPYGGFSVYLMDDENKRMRNSSNGNVNSSGGIKGRGKVRPESVIEAATLAAKGQPFEVVYYPSAGTPEFCVKASSLSAAMRIQWCSGMRFKMPFETEDSSRISWFMGTIASVQVADPILWPNSPWRLLQVTWDEPELLQNVKSVSPWLVELVSNMPVINMSPFSPPRKKSRLPHYPDFLHDDQFPVSSFTGTPLRPSSPFYYLSDSITAGIQGARQAQFGTPLSGLQVSNKVQVGLFPNSTKQLNPPSKFSNGTIQSSTHSTENVSCLLTMGHSDHNSEKTDTKKAPIFILFGQPILTEQQISHDCSRDSVSQVSHGESPEKRKRPSHDKLDHSEKLTASRFLWNQGFRKTEPELETGHCKVFLESEDVGRTLDLLVLESYEQLHERLVNMFRIERSAAMTRVLYQDATGSVKQIGDEPFSEFRRTAKRLTILMDSGLNTVGRIWNKIMPNADRRLDSSNQTGPLSIFA